MITLAPDAPRWATGGERGGNYKVSSTEFARFARAVGRRYSGAFAGLPAVAYWSIWNEPNHIFFIKPRSQAPARLPPAGGAGPAGAARDRARGLARSSSASWRRSAPRPRCSARCGSCSSGCASTRTTSGCAGTAARKAGCSSFKKVTANGFAHHPYGPVGAAVPRTRDIVNMLGDQAPRQGARPGRAARGASRAASAIYNTEFGFQTNPPDPFVSTSPDAPGARSSTRRRSSPTAIRGSRATRSTCSTTTPPARGPAALRWAGFQTGLRFPNGGAVKPAYEAYRCPIVVQQARQRRAAIWGRVRPGKGTRYVQLQRRQRQQLRERRRARSRPTPRGYFTVNREPKRAPTASRYVDRPASAP